MALPRNKKERELLELRARVAQLESELSTVAGDADSLHHDDIAPNPDPDPMDIIQLMEEELAMEQEIIPQEYSEAVDASVTSVEYGGVMDVQPTTSKRRIGYIIPYLLCLCPTSLIVPSHCAPSLCPTPSLYTLIVPTPSLCPTPSHCTPSLCPLIVPPPPSLCPTPSQTLSLFHLWTEVPLSERAQEAL